jgi:tRNA 2-thiocytidine biosynthesis protein TtcA
LTIAMGWLRSKGIYDFDFVALHVDAGYKCDFSQLSSFMRDLDIKVLVEETKINEQIGLDEPKSICYRCGRLRKGVLKRLCIEHGYDKIAFGHHEDDLVETFFMNLFETGKLSGIPPKMTEQETELQIIRPLLGVKEETIIRCVDLLEVPIVKSLCPYNGLTNRQRIKNWIKSQEVHYPHLRQRVISGLGNVDVDRLL